MYFDESISFFVANSTGFTPGLFSIFTYEILSPFLISRIFSSCFAARICCGIVLTYSDGALLILTLNAKSVNGISLPSIFFAYSAIFLIMLFFA